MPSYRCTTLAALLLIVSAGPPALAQDSSSQAPTEASPAGIASALQQGDLPGALSRYRALVSSTDELHLRSLRQICFQVIRQALDDSSPDVHVQAVRALRHGIDTESAPQLLELLRQQKIAEEFVIDGSMLPVRTEGLLPVLLEAVKDSNRLVRIWVVQALGTVGGPEVVGPLGEALDDSFFWVRLEAALALGQLEPELVPSEKLALLRRDPVPPVVLDATAVLFSLGAQECEEPLRQMLSDPDAHLADHFTVAAQKVASPAFGPLLVELLKHELPAIRAGAAQALGNLRFAGAFSALSELRTDGEVGVQAAAAYALGELGDPRGAEELARLATSEAAEVREQAVSALAKLGSQGAWAILQSALKDESSSVKLAAVRAFGDLGDKEAVPLLRPLYLDEAEAPSVRAYALVSAVRLGDGEAMSQLERQAGDDDEYTKVWAAWGLGEVGGRPQLLTLVNLLADESGLVRPVAAGALLKMSNRLEEK